MRVLKSHTLLFLFLLLPFRSIVSQEIKPIVEENGARCVTSLINNPKVIEEAWVNTRLHSPGIEEAVRQFSLNKGLQPPQVGDQFIFWVYNIQARRFDTLTAELRAIGNFSYVWVSLQELANGHVTMTEVNAMLKALEQSTSASSLDSTKGVLDIDRRAFGNPPNVNSNFEKGKGDGKTHFLICDIQDGWNGTGGFVAGFFFSVDVSPFGNSSSNKRDILYIDSSPGIYFNGVRKLQTALSTTAHEFQHLIHWNYDPSEIDFFNEGLSMYAEVLCGFEMTGPARYFSNTNVTLTSWNNMLDDYSRAAIWTLYLGEQFGLPFIKNFTQNTLTGIAGFESAVALSGFPADFPLTLQNFLTANWVNARQIDTAYGYKLKIAGRPTIKTEHLEPNVSTSATLVQQAVDYITFPNVTKFKISFNVPQNFSIRSVETGPLGARVRNVPLSSQVSFPDLGVGYTSVAFVVVNASPVFSGTYSYTASGEITKFLVEEKYDDGSPDAFTAGVAPYVGFGNNSPTRGMAVRFDPTITGNVLRKARLFVEFDQEFSNGTSPQNADKDFNFHVWGDDNGKPGIDLIMPFLVKVDRAVYPEGSFVDVDLTPFSQDLSNLSGPVYIGFTEDDDDTVATFTAVDKSTATNYSFVYRGPNHPTSPNTWVTLREVSALNRNILDGFNFMFRAVFEYSDSSAPPKIAVGYLQNPLLSEYINVIAASADELRPNSFLGTLTQSSGASSLKLLPMRGTTKVFIDTTQRLKGSGTISIRVIAAKRYGIFYSDTLVTFNARLLKRNEPVTISTVNGNFSLIADVGTVRDSVYLTAYEGISDPALTLTGSKKFLGFFSVGPAGIELDQPAILKVAAPSGSKELTLAQYRDGRWLELSSNYDPTTSTVVATTSRLGLYALMNRSDVDGKAERIPTEFALRQNFPNPFNPSTTIQFDLPIAAQTRLVIYDLLGKEVAVLIDEEKKAGRYNINFAASGLSTGVYFYRLSAGSFTQVKKLLLVK